MEGTLECDYLALAVVEVAVVLGGWEAGLDASYFVAVELVVGQHCCTCPYCEDSDDLSPIEIKKTTRTCSISTQIFSTHIIHLSMHAMMTHLHLLIAHMIMMSHLFEWWRSIWIYDHAETTISNRSL